MNRIEYIKKMIDGYIEDIDNLTFSQIISNLRKQCFSLPRSTIRVELGISEGNLFQFETNGSHAVPNLKIVMQLAYYYSFPTDLLIAKAKLQYPRIKNS